MPDLTTIQWHPDQCSSLRGCNENSHFQWLKKVRAYAYELACCLTACAGIAMCCHAASLADMCCDWQVRDEYRTDWDAGRGGYGNIVKQELAIRQETIKVQMGMYAEGQQEDGQPEDEELA